MKTYDYSWDDVLSAASQLQGHLKDAVLVGGTSVAIFADHRVSYDADHVIVNLRDKFDQILSELESVAGWQTARVKKPVLILGSLNGVETGIRQLIRTAPLEISEITVSGHKVVVPTPCEILRIKGYLILKRNATRDYLDFAALSEYLNFENSWGALKSLDSLYPQPNGSSAIQQLIVQLGHPTPFDLSSTDLNTYKHIKPAWDSWEKVSTQCKKVGVYLFDSLASLITVNS
ncbi:MAG: hypothetical protein ACRCTY_07790 [Candidatus Adiutrix sp.]